MFSRKSSTPCICPGRCRLRRRLRVERGRVDVHAGAGLHHVDDRPGRRSARACSRPRSRAARGRRSCRPSSCPPCRRCRRTTVQKMIGAIIILISLMKPSPSGFIASPVCGKKWPSEHADRDRDQHLHVERRVEGRPRISVHWRTFPRGAYARYFSDLRDGIRRSTPMLSARQARDVHAAVVRSCRCDAARAARAPAPS